jgi:rubrerythrin
MSKLLKEMIRDEKQAPRGYYRLLHELSRKKDKAVVREIIKQERQHRRKLMKIH